MTDDSGEHGQLVDLLREALPIVRSDAQEWHEGATEGVNRRRMAASDDLADRIAMAIWLSDNGGDAP